MGTEEKYVKTYRPGQLYTIKPVVFQLKKKESGCKGCYFEHSVFTCPGVLDSKTGKKKFDCVVTGTILVKVKRGSA